MTLRTHIAASRRRVATIQERGVATRATTRTALPLSLPLRTLPLPASSPSSFLPHAPRTALHTQQCRRYVAPATTVSSSSTSSSLLASSFLPSAPPRRWMSTSSLTNTPLPLLRNLAIIAHVDHGKTTLVDCLLRSAVASRMDSSQSRVMDSNALEKERGITILSKCTSIQWLNPSDNQSYHINIVDTPGHADFGGEVERVLSMVDGVALVVDATDGPMTQTKFVLSKALQKGLRPLVVINKVDRPTARVGEVENEVWDLFVTLGASDEQMDFPMVYACAKEGWSTTDASEIKRLSAAGQKQQQEGGMTPLFTALVNHVQPPKVDREQPFCMAVTQIESDQFLGKLLLGRITSGTVKVGDKLQALDPQNNKLEEVKVMKIAARRGLEQVHVPMAAAGDIVSLAGFSVATVNSTLCDLSITQSLPVTPIDPPTLSMSFGVNSSPLQGQEGTQLTSTMIRDRLLKEAESNVSLQVLEGGSKEVFEVRGRGELQLGILIETMRREGFELSVSAPQVVLKPDPDTQGKMLEPLEEVIIDTEQEFTGWIIERLSARKGELQDFVQSEEAGSEGKAKLKFLVPTRGLIGFRSELANETRGTAVMNHLFHSYIPSLGPIDRSEKGALVSTSEGAITAHALEGLESRGVLFVEPGQKTYSGMVVGENSREGDLEVNPAKSKELSNVRTVTKEAKTRLTPPRVMSLEEVIAYVREDEIIEVTPKSIRLRKIELDANKRRAIEKARAQRKKLDKAG